MKTLKDIVIEKMIDDVCRQYGFESKVTIDFCDLCVKTKNYNLIKKRYQKLIDNNNKQYYNNNNKSKQHNRKE